MVRWLKMVLRILFGLIAALLLWGVVIEPRLLDVDDQLGSVPDLPENWENRHLLVMGDFQVGMWLDNHGTFERAVKTALQERPAAVLLLGDFIYHTTTDRQSRLDYVARTLHPLAEGGIPIYAVLGNHDYGLNSENSDPREALAEELSEVLAQAGVQVLQNEAVRLQDQTTGGLPLYLVGLGSLRADHDQYEEVFRQLPEGAARVVMMHHPDSFKHIPARQAPLAFAGHTHGGQVRIPFLSNWSYLSLFREEPVHVDGWIDDYGQPGNRLYINRGIGFSNFPIRINCLPELTRIKLHRAPN